MSTLKMPTLAPLPSLAPMPTLAPLATLRPMGQTIDCATTDIPATCQWVSPSKTDLSDPKSNMICPPNTTRVWMDKENEKRKFRCMMGGQTSLETNTCKISNTTFINQCKNTWYRK